MACDAPISIRYNPPLKDGKGGLIYSFPADCGKCLKCLSKRKAQWSFRLTEEKRESFSSYFVTLTYDDKHLPWGDGVPSIDKNDHFEFIKKLKQLESEKILSARKAISWEELERRRNNVRENRKLAYYGIYEYGDQNARPHAHYLLFNVRDIDNIRLAWSNYLPFAEEQPETIKYKGIIQIDADVNVNNIDYVLKYMVKLHSSDDYEDKSREVSFMSKGIGLCAADSQFTRSIQRVDNNQVVNARGVKIPLPRYYRKKFLPENIAKAKNQYIADEVQSQTVLQDNAFILAGHNPEKIRLDGKETRMSLLKNRSKRDLKQ